MKFSLATLICFVLIISMLVGLIMAGLEVHRLRKVLKESAIRLRVDSKKFCTVLKYEDFSGHKVQVVVPPEETVCFGPGSVYFSEELEKKDIEDIFWCGIERVEK